MEKGNKKHFSKNLVMTVNDEKNFKWSNEYNEGDNKARDYDHVTVRYRGSAPKNCYFNLKLTKKITAIFHGLRVIW